MISKDKSTPSRPQDTTLIINVPAPFAPCKPQLSTRESARREVKYTVNFDSVEQTCEFLGALSVLLDKKTMISVLGAMNTWESMMTITYLWDDTMSDCNCGIWKFYKGLTAINRARLVSWYNTKMLDMVI
jgi:hypothetical protein